jgi:hypothetical protein
VDTEQFELEYDQQVELHTKDMFEVDTTENVMPPPLSLEIEADADRRLRALRYWQSEMERVRALHCVELERIEGWLDRHERRINKRMDWNKLALQEFLWDSGRKTIDLPSGKLSRRKGRERIDIVLEETFLQWAMNGHEELTRTKITPDKKAITAYVKDTSEEPPGVEFNISLDSFSVTLAK